MPDPEALGRELRELNRRWVEKLAGKLEAIEQAALPVLDGSGGRAALEGLRFLVHRLGGSGASFGCPQVSEIALKAEHTIKKMLVVDPPGADLLATLGTQLDALRKVCLGVLAEKAGLGEGSSG